MEALLPWALDHPLLSLAAMVFAAACGGWFALHPSMGEVVHRNHPRC